MAVPKTKGGLVVWQTGAVQAGVVLGVSVE